MKNLILFFIIIINIISFSSCKKFDESPVLELKTVKARLQGEWELKKYELTDSLKWYYHRNTEVFDGENVYTQTTDSSFVTPLKINIAFTKDFIHSYKNDSLISSEKWTLVEGTSKNEFIEMTDLTSFDSEFLLYKIISLHNDKLILECNFNCWYRTLESRYEFERKK